MCHVATLSHILHVITYATGKNKSQITYEQVQTTIHTYLYESLNNSYM